MLNLLIYLCLIPLLIYLKKSRGAFIISSLFLFEVFGWSEDCPDRSSYEIRYEQYDDDFLLKVTEPLYTLTMKFFHALNLTFTDTVIVFALIFLISLYWFIKHTTRNTNIVVALFMISVFPFLIVLLRTTYALTFVLPAFYLILYKENTLKNRLWFALIIIIASMIHAMCVLYLVFLFPVNVNFVKIKKFVKVFLPIVFILIGFITLTVLPWLMNLMGLSEKSELFMADTNSESNKLIQFILASFRVLSVIALPLGINYILRSKRNVQMTTAQKRILVVNWFSLLLIPLLAISHDLFRLMFVFCIINFAFASDFYKYKYCRYWTLFCTCNIGYWFIWRPYFHDVFFVTITHNRLIPF